MVDLRWNKLVNAGIIIVSVVVVLLMSSFLIGHNWRSDITSSVKNIDHNNENIEAKSCWSEKDPIHKSTAELMSRLKKEHQKVQEGYQFCEQAAYYMGVAQGPMIETICEIGFNAGHSSITWLESNSKAYLYSFDLGEHDTVKTGEAFIHEKYPNRLTLTLGNSLETVPIFIKENPNVKCDVIHVDGGHSYEASSGDLRNMRSLAKPTTVLLMDDLACTAPHCIWPVKAWKDALTEGLIEQKECMAHVSSTRGWCSGKYILP